MITGDLIRAGRALLGWSSRTLALRARVGTATVLRIERSRDLPRGQCATLEKIARALAEGGVNFVEDDRHGPGVHIRNVRPDTLQPPLEPAS
jgi:transcriptional regulator with XRE-family HTH domain